MKKFSECASNVIIHSGSSEVHDFMPNLVKKINLLLPKWKNGREAVYT